MRRPTDAIQRLTQLIIHAINKSHDGMSVEVSDMRAVVDYLLWLEENRAVVHGGTGNDMRGANVSFSGNISGGDIVRGTSSDADRRRAASAVAATGSASRTTGAASF